MRLLIVMSLVALIVTATGLPADPDVIRDVSVQKPISLVEVADAGDSHSNGADRKARWGGFGWGYSPFGGYGGWGGGWRGGWGGGGWGGGGWGGGGWGGGGWGGGWRRPWGGGWGWG